MAEIIYCVCPTPLGAQECKTQTGIAEAYYTPYQNITGVAFAASSSTCCAQGEITAFGLIEEADAWGLLQPINFVQQDDDTGALFTENSTYDAGNTVIADGFVFQVNSKNPNEECTLRSLIGQQIAILIKGKNGKWKFVNWAGGMKVSQVNTDSNLGYIIVTMTGRANKPALYVSYTDDGVWADANLIPNSLDPDGLINA